MHIQPIEAEFCVVDIHKDEPVRWTMHGQDLWADMDARRFECSLHEQRDNLRHFFGPVTLCCTKAVHVAFKHGFVRLHFRRLQLRKPLSEAKRNRLRAVNGPDPRANLLRVRLRVPLARRLRLSRAGVARPRQHLPPVHHGQA